MTQRVLTAKLPVLELGDLLAQQLAIASEQRALPEKERDGAPRSSRREDKHSIKWASSVFQMPSDGISLASRGTTPVR